MKLNNRLFGQWSFRTLNLAVSRMQEFTTNEPTDVVVSVFFIKCKDVLGIVFNHHLTQMLFSLINFRGHCIVRSGEVSFIVGPVHVLLVPRYKTYTHL